jgi:hypothetical protein
MTVTAFFLPSGQLKKKKKRTATASWAIKHVGVFVVVFGRPGSVWVSARAETSDLSIFLVLKFRWQQQQQPTSP